MSHSEHDQPSQTLSPAFNFFYFGEIKPVGWLRRQMQHDLEHGFVGCLDELVPDLIREDDLYAARRLTKAVRTKDLGVAAKEMQWEAQLLWWNSETQSNWWDGLGRTALLLEQGRYLDKVRARVAAILESQDEDGYLGIYASDLRFNFAGENGELWAQATLFRFLLGYYEGTGEGRVLEAVQKAVAVTLQAYPIRQSHPFRVKDDFAGVCHGLVFSDVLERLFQLTGQPGYLEYAAWLYEEFSQSELSQDDAQVGHLLDPHYRFKAHAVHTYEHLRALLCALYASGSPRLQEALQGYLEKLAVCLAPSGGPIGDEFIHGRQAHATDTGYEYCSIHELLDSYTHLLQKTGEARWGDQAEWLLFNAGQGARHPDLPAIAYLKSDNSFSMTGSLHAEDPIDPDNPQTRYKYSPAHQDVAVCCVPNAGRIYPYYARSMWLRSQEGLAAALYGPCALHTRLKGVKLSLREETRYPFDLALDFYLDLEQPLAFELSLRLPGWAEGFELSGAEADEVRGGFIHIRRTWQSGDHLHLRFAAPVKSHPWGESEVFFSHGPLLYALPLPGRSRPGRSYPRAGFQDEYVEAAGNFVPASVMPGQTFRLERGDFDPQRPWGSLSLRGLLPGGLEGLVPLGGTLLRQVTFPIKE